MSEYVSPVGDWETLRQELYTPEEIALCDYQVALIGELVKARDTGRITQTEYNLLFEAAEAAMDKTLEAMLDRASILRAG